MESRGKIKGSTVAAFIDWYTREVDAARLVEIVEALPEEYRSLVDVEDGRLHVLPSRWYPAEMIHTVLDALTSDMDPDERFEFAMRAGEGATEVLRRGVYKVLLAYLLTPSGYARIVSTLWKSNYDSGRVENESLDLGRQRGTVHDWASHHPFLCELHVAIKASLFRAMGCDNVEVEERYCIDRGDEMCGSILRWE